MTPNLELVELTVTPLSVALVDPFVIATGRVEHTRSVLVRATVRRGRAEAQGLGEGSALPPVTREDQPDVLARVEAARAFLVGRSVSTEFEREALLDEAFPDAPVSRCG